MTCAVPVLPTTSWPATLAATPVPAPFTAIHRPSRTGSITSGRIGNTGRGALACVTLQPCPSSTARTTCGVTSWPPLATAEIITASEMGVTVT